MKFKRFFRMILVLILLSAMVLSSSMIFSLGGCSSRNYDDKSDTEIGTEIDDDKDDENNSEGYGMFGESIFGDIGKSFEWFFTIFTPEYFGAIGSAWNVDTIIGVVMAFIMTILMFILYIILFIIFLIVIIILIIISIIITVIGYIFIFIGAFFETLFKMV